MKNLIKELQLTINYNFQNLDLLNRSLIHKSFDNQNNNEKLEFLGDRVLGLIISKILLETFPEDKIPNDLKKIQPKKPGSRSLSK